MGLQADQWGFDSGRIRERRKYCHLTQRKLAVQLGVAQSVVCEYETGKSSPSLKILIRLAAALNTSTDYLLGLTDHPYPAAFGNGITEVEQELLRVFYSLPRNKWERAVGILIGVREDK